MRGVPGLRGVVVAQADAVGMSEHRRALRAARPVLAGAVVGAGERGAVRLRSRQHVVAVSAIAPAAGFFALLGEAGPVLVAARSVSVPDIPGAYAAPGIVLRGVAK